MSEGSMLSTREVCALLNVREVTVADVVRQGEIEAPIVLGGSRVWTRANVEALRAALAARAARAKARTSSRSLGGALRRPAITA